GIGMQVHYRAVKEGIEGLPKDMLPKFKAEFIKGFHYLVPIFTIIYFLAMGYSPLKAGLYAIIALLAVTFLRTPKFMKMAEFATLFESGAKRILEVAVACGAAGIIIGIISLTGVGLRFSALIIAAAGDYTFLALLLTMFTALLLGMGLPTVAAYIIQAALIVPALIQMGIPPLAAHMFAFYFAIVSAITPPVALAAYAGAGVAGADPLKTAVTAFKLALAAFIIPFIFAYAPALLLIGESSEIILSVFTAILGIIALASAVEGWLVRAANIIERVVLFAAALTLIFPGIVTDTIGLSLFILVFVWQKYIKKGPSVGVPA
ncbi:MAG: DUF3394 domain-containing protein, partial [Desulfotomaculaceae bacterium]